MFSQFIESHLSSSLELIGRLDSLIAPATEIAELMISSLAKGGTVFWFGNGGSASDAENLAAELAGRFAFDRDPLSSFSLTANSSIFSAIANDYGYENVFSRQVKGYVKPNDVVVGITTSGKSINVTNGLSEAKRIGAQTVAFTGEHTELLSFVNLTLAIPSTITAHIQEAHIILGQAICGSIETNLFKKLND